MPHLKLNFLLISWAKENAPIFHPASMNKSWGEPEVDIVHYCTVKGYYSFQDFLKINTWIRNICKASSFFFYPENASRKTLRRIWFNIPKTRGPRLFGLFCSSNKILIQHVIQDEDDRKKHKKRERIQKGLLNYPEVQLSVTSRQLSSVLPTKVFLCGSCKRVGGPAGWQTQARVLTDDPWEVIKISKPRRPLNQTKNTSAVKGTVVHSGRLQ